MDFDFEKVVVELSKEKFPLFVSERHLQVAFIIKAKELYPKYDYIPEYVYVYDNTICHVDLMITDGFEYIAVEFKYVVKGGKIQVAGNDKYELKDQSAINIRRHQCVKDIGRLERYLKKDNCVKGYFLLITNMAGFWKGSGGETTDMKFDIKDNSTLKKGKHSPVGDTAFSKKHETIEITKDYVISYKPYTEYFKYLIVNV